MGLNQGTVSSGSGIDVTSVVNQIIDSQRGPEKLWQQQQSNLTSQTNALNSLNSSLTALQTAMQALSDLSGVMTSNTATSSQPGILTATAQSGASSGSHLIVVANLATTSSSYSDAVASPDTPLQTGVVTLQVGTTSTDITVDSTNNTLSGLANSINSQKFGVTASVITDANGARLALVSNTTGVPGDLTVTGNVTGLGFHKSVPGQNASLTIDGVPISSATNTVTGAINGVTLNLVSSAPSTPVQLSVGPNTSAIGTAVSSFIGAYNTVMTKINSQFAVDAATHTAGPLASNAALRSLQSSLLSDVTYAVAENNGLPNLAALGVNMANDGTLKLDDAAFNDALANNFSAVQNFFQGGTNGFGSHFSTDLSALTSPTQGVLNANLTEITNQQKVLTDTISDFEDRLSAREQQLIKQYSAIDAMLRQYPVTLQSINAQLATLQNYQK
ncbi:MAG: flagellar hook-associated 2 domain-containing protein [Acidobacteria bacterium]|nr:MAG: flagellar hook-associated 2 domain-containing protein [Acidobacteriota bacterium]